MSTTEGIKTSVFKKIITLIGYIVLLCLGVFAIWKIGNVWIESIVNSRQEKISQSIINTINEQVKRDLFMPDVVFINMDSTNKKQLNDSISKQIATVLTKKYIGNEKINPSEINFQPFFVFPDLPDSKGNYTLTKVQLAELKNHIQFLTIQIDKAISETKEEISNDIKRIDTEVSIWIGILVLLGIFIPILINYKATEDIKGIKLDANEAKDKAEKAHTLIDTHKDNINKVKEIITELGTLKESFEGFKGEVEQAKTESGEALRTATTANTKANKLEKLVSTLNDISKIKDIDSTFLLYNDQPLETLIKYLEEININLTNCGELFAEPIIIDVFRQLALKLHLIAPYDFINPTNFDLLNQFALGVSNIITKPLTQETYNQALAFLNTLNTNLNNK